MRPTRARFRSKNLRDQSSIRPALTTEVPAIVWHAYAQAKQDKDIAKATRLHLQIFYGPYKDHSASVEELSPKLPRARPVEGSKMRILHPLLVEDL